MFLFLATLCATMSASFLLASNKPLPGPCFGNKNTERQIIYLHGMGAPYTSGPVAYESELIKLADGINARIAAPQSIERCSKDASKVCWGNEEIRSITNTYKNILASVASCIDTQKPFTIIGFSNGGYHLGRVVMRDLEPRSSQTIAIASAGDIRIAAGDDLSAASPFLLLIGNADLALPAAQTFIQGLKNKKARAELRVFTGGHDVPFTLLKEILQAKVK